MNEVLANAAAIDTVGLTLFVVLLCVAGAKPKRPKRLRVVSGVRCWCIAFGATDCYCVAFDARKESEQDGVK